MNQNNSEMKKTLFLSIIALASMSSCKKFLDRKPLDASSATTFLTNQAEMEQGLVGVYASAMWVFPNNTPLLFNIEATTDLAIRRGGNAEDQIALGDAGPFLINNGIPTSAWAQAYKLIQRANQQIAGMENGKGNVSPQVFGKIKAEALVLRAWGYYHLLYWFGDVPYYRNVPTVPEVLNATRTPVATIVADMYRDLDEAVAGFTAANTQPVQAMGTVNRAVALGLKAKLALLVKDYRTAATATKAVIDGGQYGLNPRYPDLFTLAGQQANANREILFNQTYPTDVLDPQNWLAVITIPRQVTTSQSSHFPSQNLVDKYEASDGRRIDQSVVYNGADPRVNRDPRLKWTVYMPGDTMIYNVAKAASLPYIQPKERTIFNIYSNVRRKFNWNTGVFDNVSGGNNDWIGAQAAGIQWQVSATGNIGGVGYVWRKYIDSTQYSWETKTGYILMRYADILLMYAEAKIELGEIDGTVTGAINTVRNRAGMPSVGTTDPAQLRQIVRRERVAEFAGEGLRLFDLRRWGIYEKANSFPVVGASFDPAVPAATPTFDNDDVPNYTPSVNQRIRFRNQTRNNNNAKYKLWPIPQSEIDMNPKLLPNNPGWQ
jgi:starch-binding outer membrane protein, SusD/RagB family